ncbi:hypothetical protein XM38_022160 [Halomicronema hongdechloris C2206]|uniref:Uncharacterized protein n=1 Tax=Halomicronema hongdechloris C2206 TaxID=1641165 RepID=A0A1V8NJ16_9CYAN|nr:hypothetical protein [Halomicronema hongdechloris]ASC71264.1 hypothetical protein XM38_022160 [Halomicronema hongdechloris C2206]
MWTIEQITVEGAVSSDAYMSDGKPVVGTRRGPEGASFRLYVTGRGMLDITDTGHQPGGPHYWQLVINNQVYWYDGDGGPLIWIGTDGSVRVTGDGNDVGCQLLPLPEILESDLALLQQMKSEKLIPYGQLQPGERPYSSVEDIAAQYFAFSHAWSDLGLTVYDWTSADFFRMDIFHLYRYTAVAGQPLDDNDIIQGIWTSNWPPYTPQDPTFMASLMMSPATSEQQVAEQYQDVKRQMQTYLDALMRLTRSSMYAMPRTSTLAKPMLYSGQVAISNLGQDAMAVYFEQYPGNAGPVGSPMGMSIDEALQGFMSPDSMLTLKSFLSFTDSAQDAQHYSNGIIVEMSPPVGAVVWPQCPYLTSLSNSATKIEYTYAPGSQWEITGSRKETIGSKTYTVLSMRDCLP